MGDFDMMRAYKIYKLDQDGNINRMLGYYVSDKHGIERVRDEYLDEKGIEKKYKIYYTAQSTNIDNLLDCTREIEENLKYMEEQYRKWRSDF